MSRGGDAVRLALGTLTVLPTRPPDVVDRRVGSWAMVLAPAVGGLLALVAAAFLWVLGWGAEAAPEPPLADRPVAPLLAAALTVGLLVLLTRALHLDGLADTVDGLGSGRPAAGALEIMRRGDVGPFGVAALVLTLLLQVLALGELLVDGHGPEALLLALVVSRAALPLACVEGVPAARADGLGHVVAGTVGPGRLVLSGVVTVVAVVGGAALVGTDAGSWSALARAGLVAALALTAAGVVVHRAVRRLGGVTGDVLGAVVEVAFTVALVVLTTMV